jgi:beta-lactamase class A
MTSQVNRRVLLLGGVALAVTACAPRPARPAPTRASPRTSPSSPPPPDPHFDLASLEKKYATRLGVYALATGSGASIAYRADERFAFCSTFKTLAAAAVLHKYPLSYLDTVVKYTKADVDSISPITRQHIATGMTVRALCDAAIRYSDGTAGNLLVRQAGGLSAFAAYLRGLGDTKTRMDDYEPALNDESPTSPRDTTTPSAIAGSYRQIVLGNALPSDKRALIVDWMRRSTTSAADIRAGVPKGWQVADKTGHSDYGRADDIAVVWPPTGAPLVIAVLTDRVGYHAPSQYPIIADTARLVTSVLH